MARFEIVGLNDCPWFAKAEKLAEEINALNPTIEFHHEMKDRFHWADFCQEMKSQQGWEIKRSPVIYEVLVEEHGKGCLIGDINDFCEFAAMYFDIYYDPTSAALQAMALANKTLFGRGFEGQDRGDASIFTISIMNAPLPMLELLLTQFLSPVSMVPSGMLLNLVIFDESTDMRVLQGLLMEVVDMASPILFKATISANVHACFYQCHLFILAEDFSRGLTEEPNDWINRIEIKVAGLIEAMNHRRTKFTDCRVLVGGDGPQCYVAEMLRKAIKLRKIGPGRIVASAQHIAQKAKCELGKIGDLPAGCIVRVHAWGWPGDVGAYVEVKDAVLRGAEVSIQGPGVEIPLAEVATNSDYIFQQFSKEFLKTQKKLLGYTVPNQPRRVMCLAESIINTTHVWISSEQISPPPKIQPDGVISYSQIAEDRGPVYAYPMEKGVHPVINVGVEVASESNLPSGTFMVQPAVCVKGKWIPLGKISEKTNSQVVIQVSNLWEERQKLIYRDSNIKNLFPDFDELIGDGQAEAKEGDNPNDKSITDDDKVDEENIDKS